MVDVCYHVHNEKTTFVESHFSKKNLNSKNAKFSNLHHFSTNVENGARAPKMTSTNPGDVFTCLKCIKTSNTSV